MANERIARVIVDVANAEVDRVFDYRIPADMDLQAGVHVQVPFGPRMIDGFVVAICDNSDVPPEKLKSVIRRMQPFAALREDQLFLAGWMKDN